MKIIDPHIHLFNLEQGQYHWLKKENPPFWPDKSIIHQSFSDSDLTSPTLFELAGYVHIEAGFDNFEPWRELDAIELSSTLPFRCIANIDLTLASNKFNIQLQKLIERSSFIGVRHILDDGALRLLTDKQVITNIETLNELAQHSTLLFELQLNFSDSFVINKLLNTIKDNNHLTFVINHAGFPPTDMASKSHESWQNNLYKISKHHNVAIKCSGYEMLDRDYQASWLNSTLLLILKIFDVKRVMLASNFPLCLFSHKSYQAYWQSIFECAFFNTLNEQEKSALCYDNALHYYQLDQSAN